MAGHLMQYENMAGTWCDMGTRHAVSCTFLMRTHLMWYGTILCDVSPPEHSTVGDRAIFANLSERGLFLSKQVEMELDVGRVRVPTCRTSRPLGVRSASFSRRLLQMWKTWSIARVSRSLRQCFVNPFIRDLSASLGWLTCQLNTARASLYNKIAQLVKLIGYNPARLLQARLTKYLSSTR